MRDRLTPIVALALAAACADPVDEPDLVEGGTDGPMDPYVEPEPEPDPAPEPGPDQLEPGTGRELLDVPIRMIVNPIKPIYADARDAALQERVDLASAVLAQAGIRVILADIVEDDDIRPEQGAPNYDEDPLEWYQQIGTGMVAVYEVPFIAGGYAGVGHHGDNCDRFVFVTRYADGWVLAHELLHTMKLGHRTDTDQALMWPSSSVGGTEMTEAEVAKARKWAESWYECTK